MQFGLATATATIMQLITILFSKKQNTKCLAYFKDIIVFDVNYIKCLAELTRHSCLKLAHLKLKPRNWAFQITFVNFWAMS